MSDRCDHDQEIDLEEQQILAAIEAALPAMPTDRHQLIPLLQHIQGTHGYLPLGGIALVARHLKMAASKVYGVATFYNQFRFNPPGRHPLKVCLGTACHVKGGEIILENFSRRLGIAEGETTKDREYSLERVACVGCCALAPVVMVGEKTESYVTPSKVEGIITEIEIQNEIAERAKEKHEPESDTQ
ncbi:MAG: NADH-quinone oxidoreductase subunit NuoE [Deltaproteobacteria bacterium]|nr:NADH-quinone oxidoreductase subunit NuoE [Candidatus Anaeroferrophillus wilburensis]MBN2888565.1 NADH-quinone oxidoreductase subunit NuoE [Deltaproteobacteria bacterium]